MISRTIRGTARPSVPICCVATSVYSGARRASRSPSTPSRPRGCAAAKSGLFDDRAVRCTIDCTEACSQTTDTPEARWPTRRDRFAALSTIPPPVATTAGIRDSRTSARTVASSCRNDASPSAAKISLIIRPARLSISASVSMKGRFNSRANIRPTDVFPTPISPTSTMCGADTTRGSRETRRNCA